MVQLSTAIIFGLGFSTLLTLVLVPVLLTVPDKLRGGLQKLGGVSQLRETLGRGSRQSDTPAE